MPTVTGLGHVGLYVKDMDVMVEFYSNFLGMTVTDRPADDRIVFLSARPEVEHHELALALRPEVHSEVQQVSFTVGALEDLQEFYRQIRARNLKIEMVLNHGNAFGCYFRDPEDNIVEVYWHTGIDYPQPHGDRIDLEAPAEELLALIENMPPKERDTSRLAPA